MRIVYGDCGPTARDAVGESGGYAMLIGPDSSASQREDFKLRIAARRFQVPPRSAKIQGPPRSAKISRPASQREDFKARIEANPRNYIAQPTLDFSRSPCLQEDGTIEPRHVDLRPYILFGDKVTIAPAA